MKIENISNGDLILFHSNGFQPMSWAIRTLTRSYWNHAGIFHKGFVIEARKTVEKNSIDKYLDNPKFDLGIFRVKQSAYKDVKQWIAGVDTAITSAEAQVGKSYDKRALIWLGIKYLTFGFLGKLFHHNPLQKREEFFCSELVCECYHKTSSLVKNVFAGKKHPEATCGTITPRDIGKSVNSEWVAGTNKR